jgi:hypothetical protein
MGLGFLKIKTGGPGGPQGGFSVLNRDSASAYGASGDAVLGQRILNRREPKQVHVLRMTIAAH